MIGEIFLICFFAFLLGGAGLYWASRTANTATRRSRGKKFATYLLLVHVVLVSALLGRVMLVAFFAAIVTVGAVELFRVLYSSHLARFSYPLRIAAGYFTASLLLLAFVFNATPQEVIFAYLIVAAFDGFSQVAGQLAGQLVGTHPLANQISPSKTIEGAIGGFCAAVVMSLAVRGLVGLNIGRSVVACTAITAAALTGDLLASWVKRKGGVKDFGRVLPGHGGALDRFDSFLFAGPVYLLLLHLKF
jgi:phosphatidate cytidylyltransferase